MNGISHIIFLAIWLLSSISATAQDKELFKELYAKMEQSYEEKEAFSYEVHYQYLQLGIAAPLQSLSGLIYKKGEEVYSKMGSMEYLFLNSSSLSINHDSKSVVLSEALKDEAKINPINLSQLLSFVERVKVTNCEQYYECELTFKQIDLFPYSYLTLQIEQDSFALLQQEIGIKNGNANVLMPADLSSQQEGKLLMKFTPSQQEIPNHIFKSSHYITGSNQLVKKFRNYQLYNTIQ